MDSSLDRASFWGGDPSRKKHLKELKDLDKKEIHDPSEKIRNQLNYPKQILDLKESRLRAIDAFSAAKN